ncbi:unnamed protein product [Caenorhabditis angaria]|uniref:DUF4773 domain-containing protein n=1 Tax=Caenorhabditis angaria TaxID=860376 RepID=A0A9P1I3Z0_9PELO|nr:unnamed protein product [Caenorhabditis angaria]
MLFPTFSFILLFLSIDFSLQQTKTQVLDISITPKSPKNIEIKLLDTKFKPIHHLVPRKSPNSQTFYGRIRREFEGNSVNILELQGGFRQNLAIFSSFSNISDHLTISGDEYKLKIASKIVDLTELLMRELKGNGCSCVHGNCACCVDVEIPEFRHNACVNATYNPSTVGLDLSIGIDGHYFTQEISIRNPPPVCISVPIPGAEHIAGICVAFTDLDLNKEKKILSGCIDLEIELVHLRVVQVKVGCFKMPV